MRNGLRGRLVRPQEYDERGPAFALMAAVVRRAQKDVRLAVGKKRSDARYPSAQEKIEAQEFLTWCVAEFSGEAGEDREVESWQQQSRQSPHP